MRNYGDEPNDQNYPRSRIIRIRAEQKVIQYGVRIIWWNTKKNEDEP
jgi:hypothetical protein